jgi:hypothetical protein
MAEEKSNNSTKKLVKILVIVGIGIPILVELMTLFNLINVQIFEDNKDTNGKDFNVEDVRGFGEGDTLFADRQTAVLINQLRVKVSAQEWRFALGMTSLDSISQDKLQIGVDSMKLKSNRMLLGNESSSWEVKQLAPAKVYGEWQLPNGDIPKKLFISIDQQISEDSTSRISQEVALDKIPVRYNQE